MADDVTAADLVATPQLGRPPWPKSAVPKASALLADELRNQIVKNRMPPGTDLPGESELIKRTGYSRGTVREALRLLESEGLITTRRGPQGGVRVSRPDTLQATRSMAVLLALSDANLRDLFQFRRRVESEAARLAAAHATPEQVEAMMAATADDANATVPGVVSFHTLIANACGNEFFRVALAIVLDIAEWHTPNEGLSPVDVGIARDAHREVVEHIAAGRGDEAAAAMDRHLESFESVVRNAGHLDMLIMRPETWES